MGGLPSDPALRTGSGTPIPALRLVVALVAATIATWSLVARSVILPCGDLCSYYTAGLLAREGRPADAFDAGALAARHRDVHDLGQRTGPFFYSPLGLAPAALLAGDPLPEAAREHRAAGAVLLGLGLLALLLALDSVALMIAVATAFALSHAGWVQLIYANWSFALFALAALLIWSLRCGSSRLAVVAGALALHLKPFVLFAFLPLAAARRRLVLGIAATAILLAALTLPFVGTAPWAKFGSFLAGRGTAGVTPYYSKASLAANLARLESPPRDWIAPRAPADSPAVRYLFWAGLPLLAWGARRLRESPPAAFSFGLAWVLLFVPQIWEHTEILLFAALPPLARRAQWLLAALLAGTASYNALQQGLLMDVVRGADDSYPLAALLWLYPALNLLVLLFALDVASGGRRVAETAAAA